MARVQIIDKKKNTVIVLKARPDNTLAMEYLRSKFPTAIGLEYLDPIENEMKLFVAYVTTTGT